MNSREAGIESSSSRFVLGELIDTEESVVELEMGEPGRKRADSGPRELIHRRRRH